MEKEKFSLKREMYKRCATAVFVLAALGLLGHAAYEADKNAGNLPSQRDQTEENLRIPMGAIRW